MCSVRQWLSLIVAVGFGSFLSPQLAWPLLYQCREANGGTIFTDSTAQLQHCLAINMGTAARLSYPVGTAAGSSASPVASEGSEPPSVPVSSDLLEKPAPVPSAQDDALPRNAADYEIRKATRPNRYPLSLEELTQRPKRYLQVVYKDPITGQDFELIKIGAEVRGVRSRSKERPLDRVRFTDAETYDQITFQAIERRGQPCRPVPNPINPLNPFGAGPC